MFDANMRYLPRGKKFFCKIYQCDKDSTPYHSGIRKGDLYLCTMLDDCNKDPRVQFELENGPSIIKHTSSFYGFWAVYEGNGDGDTDFINEDSRRYATKIVKGLS